MSLRLENLCLDVVANNFERYNLVFITTKDENMKRKFEFLQRKYSFDLLKRMSAKADLPEQYIDLLINKYLKIIKTSWFRECSWDKITSKIAEIGYNIEKITFMKTYLGESWEECYKPPWEDVICYLPNLKSFTFRHNCRDSILTNVAKFCPDIEEIDVEGSKITFKAVKYLCKNENEKALCTKLKKLYIARTRIRDDDVVYLLKNLPSLETIDYFGLPVILYSLHKNDLLSLDKVRPYNIATLDLMNFANISFSVDILKICLSVCPHLKSLTCGLVNKEDLDFFSNLSDLENLHIKKFSRSEININDLLKSKGEKLTSLKIVNCTVSISVLAESCPHLKELNLSRIHFLFDDDSKPVFNSLSSCTFESSNVSKSAKAISLLLSSSEKLESVSFKRCNLSSSEIKSHILKCCELYPIKKISFCRSVIKKEYVKDILLNCHTLSYLDIDGCFCSYNEKELMKFAEGLSNKPAVNNSKHFFRRDNLDSFDQLENSKYFYINDRDYEGYFEICKRRRKQANENCELEDDYSYDYDDYNGSHYDYAYQCDKYDSDELISDDI